MKQRFRETHPQIRHKFETGSARNLVLFGSPAVVSQRGEGQFTREQLEMEWVWLASVPDEGWIQSRVTLFGQMAQTLTPSSFSKFCIFSSLLHTLQKMRLDVKLQLFSPSPRLTTVRHCHCLMSHWFSGPTTAVD